MGMTIIQILCKGMQKKHNHEIICIFETGIIKRRGIYGQATASVGSAVHGLIGTN